jgi:hypothetical protein
MSIGHEPTDRPVAVAGGSPPPAPGESIATFIRDLAPHEQILVQPGGLIWKDRTVGMFLHFEYPRGAYWFSSAKWQAKTVWLLLQGPGRVAVQSVFERPEGTGTVRRDSGSSTRHWQTAAGTGPAGAAVITGR